MKDTGERLIVEGNEQNLSYGEHLARYLSVEDIVRDKVVLDVASGAGYGSQIIAKYAKQVTGIDYSADAVKYAKKKYPAKNLTFQQDNAEKLKTVKDDSIDVVVSFETIEHLHNPEAFVAQVKRVLKKDGIFIVSTPNDNEFLEGNEFHVHQFDFKELKKTVGNNFKSIEYYFQGTTLTANLLKQISFEDEFSRELKITKTVTEKTNKAMYYIAVASNIEKLPELKENFVTAQRWSTKDYVTRDNHQNGVIESQKQRIQDVEAENLHLKEQLNSKSYGVYSKLVKPMRIAKNTLRKSSRNR